MAKAKFYRIFESTPGLNNVLDPVRLAFDPRTGSVELSQAVNINVGDSGRISRRLGRRLKRPGAHRCGFVHGEVCLFVSGTDLYQLHPDYSATLVRSGLTEGARMRYCPVADRIYYTNDAEKGYVSRGADFAWVKGNFKTPFDTNRTFSNPPTGHIVGWFGGRMLVAKGNVMFASEPSFYGAFDLHRSFKMEAERITMIQPTPQGIWVGTTARVLFYRGGKWEEVRREVKADSGVLEGSDVWAEGAALGTEGRNLMFTTPEGIFTASEGGTLLNLTHNKLNFPSGKYAHATVAGNRYIILIEP